MCPSVSENLNSGQKMSENLNSDPENCPKIWIQIPKIFWKTWIQIQILEFQKSEQLNWEILGKFWGKLVEKEEKSHKNKDFKKQRFGHKKTRLLCPDTQFYIPENIYIFFYLYNV